MKTITLDIDDHVFELLRQELVIEQGRGQPYPVWAMIAYWVKRNLELGVDRFHAEDNAVFREYTDGTTAAQRLKGDYDSIRAIAQAYGMVAA